MDCSPLASSVHGILQARILEWVAPLQGISTDPCLWPTHVNLDKFLYFSKLQFLHVKSGECNRTDFKTGIVKIKQKPLTQFLLQQVFSRLNLLLTNEQIATLGALDPDNRLITLLGYFFALAR